MNTLIPNSSIPCCEPPKGPRMVSHAQCDVVSARLKKSEEPLVVSARDGFGAKAQALTHRRHGAVMVTPSTSPAQVYKHLDVFVSSDASMNSPKTWREMCVQSKDIRRQLAFGKSEETDQSAEPSRPEGSWVIRWLEDSETRVPMVVVPTNLNRYTNTPVWESAPASTATWAVVVPVWTDVENAVPGDLILNEVETSTRMPWRAAFRHQTTLPQEHLGDCLGWLTTEGSELFTAALDGQVPLDRTGSPLESEFDPRLDADLWITEAIGRSLANVEAEENDDRDDWLLDDGANSGEGSIAVGEGGEFSSWVLRPRFAASTRGHFALAAAPTQRGGDECFLEWQSGVEKFVAKLRPNWAADELWMDMIRVPSALVDAQVFVIVAVKNRRTLTTSGRITGDGSIVLARNEAIDQWDVESVELRLQ